MTFVLPASGRGQFYEMFRTLEEKQGELHVASFGVSDPTLEEVITIIHLIWVQENLCKTATLKNTSYWFSRLIRAFSSNYWKRPLAKLGKMINLTSKLGEINGINIIRVEMDPQNQVILDCIMPSIPLNGRDGQKTPC